MATEVYIGSYGFTEVIRDKHRTYVCHNGNMGNTEADVRSNFDKMSFEGAYDMLSLHKTARKSGSPDYSFSLSVTNTAYNKIIGR